LPSFCAAVKCLTPLPEDDPQNTQTLFILYNYKFTLMDITLF
jgi:hypothetical protein